MLNPLALSITPPSKTRVLLALGSIKEIACRFGTSHLSWLTSALAALALSVSAVRASTNLQFKAEASIKETYDSNVYLQDQDANAAYFAKAKADGFQPVEANHGSFVTSLVPKIGLDFKADLPISATIAYSPDINIYHDASSENYVAHRANLNLIGKTGDTSWEFLNSATYIDGNTEGPTFARPDDIPAVGGIPLRDRRAAFVFRNGFRLTQTLGDWFIRPVAGSYIHDFKTDQRYVPPSIRSIYSYENYIDRQEISGGVDFGYRAFQNTFLVLGYRYGQQDQFLGPYGAGGKLIDSPFDSSFHRILLGMEGSPVSWLKVNLAIGPDIRDFSPEAHQMYPTFDPNVLLYYLDASVSWLPTKSDTISLKATRYEQPAFSSFSVYEDIKNDLLWRHKFTEELTGTLGFTLYIGDWQPPAHRNDWIYTPNGSLSYAFSKHLTADLAYSYDWVDSNVSAEVEPFTKGHEFTRHLASLAVRYVF